MRIAWNCSRSPGAPSPTPWTTAPSPPGPGGCRSRRIDFRALVQTYGKGADWIVVPDIVAGGLESLAFSERWLPELDGVAPLLLAVQDGMTPADIRDLIGPKLGVFIGGTTEWKLGSARQWGQLCRQRDAALHMGRVNTRDRLGLAIRAGCGSSDGTGASRFAIHAERMAAWRDEILDKVRWESHQLPLF